MRIWRPGGEKNISPLLNCSNGEKAEILWGTKLDMRKKEKKATRYNALKICPIHIVSQTKTISVRVLISIIFLIFAANFLLRIKDFWKYFILGSKNENTERPCIARLVFIAER